jgi:hypothetical protein
MTEGLLISAFGGVLVLFLSVIASLSYSTKKVSVTTLEEVRKINGRLGKLEEKVIGEVRLSDERQKATEHRLEELEH